MLLPKEGTCNSTEFYPWVAGPGRVKTTNTPASLEILQDSLACRELGSKTFSIYRMSCSLKRVWSKRLIFFGIFSSISNIMRIMASSEQSITKTRVPKVAKVCIFYDFNEKLKRLVWIATGKHAHEDLWFDMLLQRSISIS